MRNSRLYVETPLAPHADIDLPRDSVHYLARVLRSRVGDTLTLFDGRGGEYPAKITSLTKTEGRVRTDAQDPVERESPLNIGLIQGVSRGERMDYTIEKAVELGVTSIKPVLCERGVVKLDEDRADKRRAHWRSIVTSACQQCGRNRIPALSGVVPLAALLDEDLPGARLLLAPRAPAPLAEVFNSQMDVWLLAGPEGGLTEHEYEAACRATFKPCHLGPRVLRTETAAVAALAVLQSLAGDFR